MKVLIVSGARAPKIFTPAQRIQAVQELALRLGSTSNVRGNDAIRRFIEGQDDTFCWAENGCLGRIDIINLEVK